MALKYTWVDKVDDVDINSANDINQLAHAIIELEENGGGGNSGLPEVTEADNDKFLKVVDGTWQAATIVKYLGEYEEVK